MFRFKFPEIFINALLYNHTSIQLDESDIKRKEVLRHRVNDYIRRAETLKVAFIDKNTGKHLAPENKGNVSSLQRISLEKSSAFIYNELRLYCIGSIKKCLSQMKFDYYLNAIF